MWIIVDIGKGTRDKDISLARSGSSHVVEVLLDWCSTTQGVSREQLFETPHNKTLGNGDLILAHVFRKTVG